LAFFTSVVHFGTFGLLMFFGAFVVAFLIISMYFCGIIVAPLDCINASIAFVAPLASAFVAYSLSFRASFDILAGENIALHEAQTAAPIAAFFNMFIGSSAVIAQIVPPIHAHATFTSENTCRAWSCAIFSPIDSASAEATS